MNIQSLIPILTVVGVLIVIGLVILFAVQRMRSQRLKQRFGPEYDYTLQKLGDRRETEKNLASRQKRVVELDLHSLDEKDRYRYHSEWTEIQANFVDDPSRAIERANQLVTEVMIARGFPVADFEQRAADLSVLYPNFVPDYRDAYSIAKKNQNGGTSTEELRQAMVYYHNLFDELLETNHAEEKEMELAK